MCCLFHLSPSTPRILEVTFFPVLFILKPIITYRLGGMAAVTWTIAFPLVVGYHSTFLVNSAAHVWGTRPYETGDLSTNNAFVSFLAFGEGWHCSHHAFPYSARHGLDPGELDPTWWLICAMQALGLAWDVKVPSEKAKAEKRRIPSGAAGAGVTVTGADVVKGGVRGTGMCPGAAAAAAAGKGGRCPVSGAAMGFMGGCPFSKAAALVGATGKEGGAKAE